MWIRISLTDPRWWEPWSSGQSSGLRSGRSAVRISSDAKIFIYSFIYLFGYRSSCLYVLSILLLYGPIFHIAKEEEDGGKTRIVPKSSRDWNNQRRLLRGKMDVQKEQAQLEEHLH